MAKKAKNKQEVDFPFYIYLRLFLDQEKKKVYAAFHPLTKKFLKFNESSEGTQSYLRKPQFEALEMYVFLKEFCNNEYLYTIFQDWYKKNSVFAGRMVGGINHENQITLFSSADSVDEEDIALFEEVFRQIKAFQQIYPNYIFSLTMGLGKTVLMATCIFYEFLLANKFPKDERFCHNALVFAPDKTVLQSLREIETFDKSKVVPPEYVNWLDAHLKFFFLDESGDALNTIDSSKYNIIISNTQKIILKKQHKAKTASQALFSDYSTAYKAKSLNKDFEDLYGFDIDTDAELITNQRFAKLTRLKQLGIYVDEAHHVFGSDLAKDFGIGKSATSLRITINELAENLKETGSKVVGCYNFTGTPYVGSRLLPEVVYSYGLKDAIKNQFLKQVDIQSVANVKEQTLAFVRLAIRSFWEKQKGKRYENMLPKMAFFASSIKELQDELKPAVEKVLGELEIPFTKILVNVGDSTLTTNDDLREFKNLDSPQSEKQFILLVNKGKEGWNCRSLFAVGLHRTPKSTVFVLQATMRCLRSIDPKQQVGQVFLSEENVKILEDELDKNFKLTLTDLHPNTDNKETIEVHLVPPNVTLTLNKVRKLYQLKEKTLSTALDLELDKVDRERYRITATKRKIEDISKKVGPEIDYTEFKDKRAFSAYTLVAEIARYLNLSPLKIKSLLDNATDGIDKIVDAVNEFNELLYDYIIPRLFAELFELEEFERKEKTEIELVKAPKEGDCYFIKANKELLAALDNPIFAPYKSKSFHLDNYCFDSKPEYSLFYELLQSDKIESVWFTGMLTHGQSDFVISYIDPISNTLRSYYPDFLVLLKNGKYIIIEVKGDHMIEDEVVQAKMEYATQLAASNTRMEYALVKSSEVGRFLSTIN